MKPTPGCLRVSKSRPQSTLSTWTTLVTNHARLMFRMPNLVYLPPAFHAQLKVCDNNRQTTSYLSCYDLDRLKLRRQFLLRTIETYSIGRGTHNSTKARPTPSNFTARPPQDFLIGLTQVVPRALSIPTVSIYLPSQIICLTRRKYICYPDTWNGDMFPTRDMEIM